MWNEQDPLLLLFVGYMLGKKNTERSRVSEPRPRRITGRKNPVSVLLFQASLGLLIFFFTLLVLILVFGREHFWTFWFSELFLGVLFLIVAVIRSIKIPQQETLETSDKKINEWYADRVQPALHQLKQWINGPNKEFEDLLQQCITKDGVIVQCNEKASISFIFILQHIWGWAGPVGWLPVRWHKALREHVVPAALKASESGREVLWSLERSVEFVEPLISKSVVYKQIVTLIACIRYKIKLASEIKDSIGAVYYEDTVYYPPRAFKQDSPCNESLQKYFPGTYLLEKHKHLYWDSSRGDVEQTLKEILSGM